MVHIPILSHRTLRDTQKGSTAAVAALTARSAGRGAYANSFLPWTIAVLYILALVIVATSPSYAEQRSLSLPEAIRMALAQDPNVESANWDWLDARAKAEAAEWRKAPSLSIVAGYERLSDLADSTVTTANPFYPVGPGNITFDFPPSLTNMFSISANLQYPVFAGFRLQESAAIAHLLVESKSLAKEAVTQALAFEVQRAYWEVVRATKNLQTLRENLDLIVANGQIVARQFSQGTATDADQLSAEARTAQAKEDFNNAAASATRAYVTLASLVGMDTTVHMPSPDSPEAVFPFALSSKPEDGPARSFSEAMDQESLIEMALGTRPETRGSVISLQMAEKQVKLSQAPIFPTLSIIGNYTYANPNQRVIFQTDPWQFTGTWMLGVQVSYDIGGLPANFAESRAQEAALKKAQADARKLREALILDVESCVIELERARSDLALSRSMLGQAKENVRVAEERRKGGVASDLDLLAARVSLLRTEFVIENKRIDELIASADLARAIGAGNGE